MDLEVIHSIKVLRHGGLSTLVENSYELEGFTVLDTIEGEGQVEVVIELTAGAGVCPGCAGVSTAVYERSEAGVRDVLLQGKPTYLEWRNRGFRCEEPECERVTFSEEHAEVPPPRTSFRFRRHLARRSKWSPVLPRGH